ncbi:MULTISPECIES: MFS transporter [Pseudoalteromonas]|uniref:Major facilitator superfamily (MFS) profile domain-containing protein n=2 Tax=Pseudoalteromonas TaxID=53246 RepID=A0A0U2NFH7_9GAMM|nr:MULTISPECIES: MFS transporter [Pseudoalteromonas]ALS32483.1 hypothetical protein PTRA_a1237 [Pseudoalteromonas translucida KMM 520]MBH0070781.1 MFS transporter [Pseudoalteromonas sp. NZS127]MBO7927504.1 MFS transporter [Pseudoalteromonas sp. K222D]|tara:strand:+ start:8830 stop:10074 length:1245 start_codon:yes stop_codon:yes gene_type:complete
MRATYISLLALFFSCFILLLGNGLLNVLLPVRMGLDGVDIDTIGMVLSLYFVGLLIGALYSINLIRRVGHIRMFAGCVALGAISVLMYSIYPSIILLAVMRVIIGFCNACAFTAMESWLSDSSTKQTRGKMLAVYNSVVLCGLFGGQFFMGLAEPQQSTLFVLVGILLCASVIPLIFSRHTGPTIQDVTAMPLLALYRISPLGVVTCFISGLIYSAIFNLLPVFALQYNIIEFQLSLYMGAAIFGAFLLQFPVGYFSDRYDRRSVLLILLCISVLADIAVVQFVSLNMIPALFIVTALTSGIIACTYPLSISEAFDRLKKSEMAAAMGSMILAFALGGIIGPYTTSVMMKEFGVNAMFYFMALVQLFLAVFVVYRMIKRPALPIDEQEVFVMQSPAISPAIEFDPRTEQEPESN